MARHPAYLASRLRAVAGRYGVTTRKAKERVRRCVRRLEQRGVRPTFATPGRIVDQDPSFFRELRDAGVELAIHGYDHADFRRLTREQAAWQFEQALAAYARHGVPCVGFRCPYLSCTADVRAVLPVGAFTYSSNRAVAWPAAAGDGGGAVFEQLARNYRAAPCAEVVAAPAAEDGLIEIPVSVPDDLQLCDGLGLGEEGLRRQWLLTLQETQRRGELFAPLFHPEAYDLLETAVDGLLDAVRAQRPAVWATQLRDVAAWWRERAAFGVRTIAEDGALVLELDCSERATVLVSRWRRPAALRPWDGPWSILDDRRIRLEGTTRPFVATAGVDAATVAFLVEQGYVVDADRDAECSVALTSHDVQRLGSRRALLEHVERAPAPLVRFGRWPSDARSAFCLAGDLDALSLRDYALRLHPRVRARSGLTVGARRRAA
ncbi:MAG TPA: polysaccharide deacetylase family protein [Baekduia sp.]|nr:polysaccharide deacetylase family protein [Baekduia sp.]